MKKILTALLLILVVSISIFATEYNISNNNSSNGELTFSSNVFSNPIFNGSEEPNFDANWNNFYSGSEYNVSNNGEPTFNSNVFSNLIFNRKPNFDVNWNNFYSSSEYNIF